MSLIAKAWILRVTFQGNASEEKLIASAKGVANSTAQLLMACMVKADQHSENAQRLQTAGNKVKKAADVLVKAAQSAAVFDEQEVSFSMNFVLIVD